METIKFAKLEDLKPGNYFLWYGPNKKSYKTLIEEHTRSNSNVVALLEYDIVSPSLVQYYAHISDVEIINNYILSK